MIRPITRHISLLGILTGILLVGIAEDADPRSNLGLHGRLQGTTKSAAEPADSSGPWLSPAGANGSDGHSSEAERGISVLHVKDPGSTILTSRFVSLGGFLTTPPRPRRVAGRLIPVSLGDRFQDALDGEFASHTGVGASASVITPGRETWSGACGTSDGTAVVTPSMLFGIASITKTYVATVILQLAEEGVLSLEDTIDLWIAPLPNIDGSSTIRQLLNHTSGVFDFAEHPGYVPAISSDPTRQWTPLETIDEFVLEPYAAPGVLFHYSNTGYLLLGLIIERAAGSQVSAEIRSRILTPLNLSDTFFALEEVIDGEIAHPWSDLDLDGVLEDIAFAPRTSGESTAWTSGALYSSAEDVARFLSAMIQGELMDSTSLDQMLDFHPATTNLGYGLGVHEVYDFVNEWSGVGHDGGTYGYTARMISLPDQGVYISVLLNHNSPDPEDDYQTIHAITRALARVAVGE